MKDRYEKLGLTLAHSFYVKASRESHLTPEDFRLLAEMVAALVMLEVDLRQDRIEAMLGRIGEINASDASPNGEHRSRLLQEIKVNLGEIRKAAYKA